VRSDSWVGWITSPPGEEVQLALSGQVYVPNGGNATLTKRDSGPARELHLELAVVDPEVESDSPTQVRYDENLDTGDEYEVFFVWDGSSGEPIVERQAIERVPWKGS